MITKISSTKNGQIVYHFDNGVILSFIWSWGSYTENHDDRRHIDSLNSNDLSMIEYTSKTVEIYSMGDNPNGIEEYLINKYYNNPAGYVPVTDIPKILKRADKICRLIGEGGLHE